MRAGATTSGLIAVIDDNADDIALARRALEGLPHQVSTFCDADSACDAILDASSQVPDLVLLDLRMPGSTGFDVLHRLRSHSVTRTLPIVVFTSSNSQRDIDDAFAAGASSYVVKPIDFDEFVATLRNVTSYWITVNVHQRERGGA